MKIAIYYDSLSRLGGGSRVAIELANKLHADIITCGYDPQINKILKIDGKVRDIGNISHKYSQSLSYYFESPFRFLMYKPQKYDKHIFIGNFSIFASKKENYNIWFSYSPNRLLYDLKKWKLKNADFINSLFWRLHILLFHRLDQSMVRNNFMQIVAQSKTVKQRIVKYYNKNSTVIYSPLDVTKYRFNSYGDYFLAVSRLTVEKRMDLIARAFKTIGNKKLIMVGEGLLKREILELIKGCQNITLLSNVSEKKLIDLYSNCIATIFMPKDEDYGLVPLEGMASGKICVAANEGGCNETIIHGKTGYLIKAKEKDIIDIVSKLDIDKVKNMKDDCINQAKKFDTETCIASWRNIINKN